LTQLPTFPRAERPPRIDRDVAMCSKYHNPLSDAVHAQTMGNTGLIAYAYDALCALAYDLGVPRNDDETPYEFLQRLPKPLHSLRDEAAELTQLYVTSAYASYEYDDTVHDRLRKFWHTYNRVRRRIVR